MSRKTASWRRTAIATTVLLSAWASADASNDKEMLPQLLSGSSFELRVWDRDGRQELQSSITATTSPTSDPETIELEMEVRTYAEAAEPKSRTVKWVCSPEAARMLMPIMILSSGSLDKNARVEFIGDPLVYPTEPTQRDLPNIEFVIKVKTGVLSLFGTRTRITLVDRKMRPIDFDPDGGAEISANGTFKAYLARIPVRRRKFLTRERISPAGRLVTHEIQYEDGARSILTRISGPASSPTQSKTISTDAKPAGPDAKR